MFDGRTLFLVEVLGLKCLVLQALVMWSPPTCNCAIVDMSQTLAFPVQANLEAKSKECQSLGEQLRSKTVRSRLYPLSNLCLSLPASTHPPTHPPAHCVLARSFVPCAMHESIAFL